MFVAIQWFIKMYRSIFHFHFRCNATTYFSWIEHDSVKCLYQDMPIFIEVGSYVPDAKPKKLACLFETRCIVNGAVKLMNKHLDDWHQMLSQIHLRSCPVEPSLLPHCLLEHPVYSLLQHHTINKYVNQFINESIKHEYSKLTHHSKAILQVNVDMFTCL